MILAQIKRKFSVSYSGDPGRLSAFPLLALPYHCPLIALRMDNDRAMIAILTQLPNHQQLI